MVFPFVKKKQMEIVVFGLEDEMKELAKHLRQDHKKEIKLFYKLEGRRTNGNK